AVLTSQAEKHALAARLALVECFTERAGVTMRCNRLDVPVGIFLVAPAMAPATRRRPNPRATMFVCRLCSVFCVLVIRMRARPDAQVFAAAPVVEVVLTGVAGAGIVRDFILPVTRCAEDFLRARE